MDLANLTRPAILSQCLRCASSLAALENDWAQLSATYSMPAGWQSINLQRLSVSTEKRQIPQTSEMAIIRGRIIQEVSCKLCQQKLGVLCMLENGPNVLWKMSKISFREIVTMKTAEPIFSEAALERQRTSVKDHSRRDRTSGAEAALVLSGPNKSIALTPSMQQEMHHQGRSIDQISTSVNNLQDTMSDLKHSFNSLRIELNGPTRHMGDSRSGTEHGFDMIATVLKELKSKSEEIEKLKLEIEALKFKNRFMEDRKPGSPGALSVMDGAVSVQSPGSVQAGRKRLWPDAFPSSHIHPIPDSFAEDDEEDDLSTGDLANHANALFIKDGPQAHQSTHRGSSTPRHQPENTLEDRNPYPNQNSHPDQSPAKRPRLVTESTPESSVPEKRRPGRPRKSISQPTNAGIQGSSLETHTQVPTSNHTQGTSQEDKRHRHRSQSRRSVHGQSRGASETNEGAKSVTSDKAVLPNGNDSSDKRRKVADGVSSGGSDKESRATETEEEMRKAKIAARDTMSRIAMQREEAMEAD